MSTIIRNSVVAGTTLLGEIVTAEMENPMARFVVKTAMAQVTASKREVVFMSVNPSVEIADIVDTSGRE
jgi:hypothetical protein